MEKYGGKGSRRIKIEGDVRGNKENGRTGNFNR